MTTTNFYGIQFIGHMTDLSGDRNYVVRPSDSGFDKITTDNPTKVNVVCLEVAILPTPLNMSYDVCI